MFICIKGSSLFANHTLNMTSTKIINIIAQPSHHTKQITCKEKEKKIRVEAQCWDLSDEELEHSLQQEIMHHIYSNIYENAHMNKTKYSAMFISHIKHKISSYKHQDITKTKFNHDSFITFSDVVGLIYDSKLTCHYCSCNVYILYSLVREKKQWSLDRINNNIGHNKNNLVVACLECNLKRRRTNKDAFMFTTNLKITKLNDNNQNIINEEQKNLDEFSNV